MRKILTFDEIAQMEYHEILDAIGVKIGEYVSEGRIESMSREVELMPEVKEKLQQGGKDYPLSLMHKINFIMMIDCLQITERTEYGYWYEFYRVFTDSPFYIAEMYFSRTNFINMAYGTVLVDIGPRLSRFRNARVYFNYTNIDIKAIPEHLGYLTGLGEKVIHDFCGDDYSGLWDEVRLVLDEYEYYEG